MDDSGLFSHPVVAEPLSAEEAVRGPVACAVFSDAENAQISSAHSMPR